MFTQYCPTTIALGHLLRSARQSRGWTISHTIGEADFPQLDANCGTLARIESGECRFPDDRIVRQLARTLGVPLDDAFEALSRQITNYQREYGEPQVMIERSEGSAAWQPCPSELDTRGVLEHARKLARQQSNTVAVRFPNGKMVRMHPDGGRSETWYARYNQS
jgi:transcriptional regulator with XRE-family HTH domain